MTGQLCGPWLTVLHTMVLAGNQMVQDGRDQDELAFILMLLTWQQANWGWAPVSHRGCEERVTCTLQACVRTLIVSSLLISYWPLEATGLGLALVQDHEKIQRSGKKNINTSSLLRRSQENNVREGGQKHRRVAEEASPPVPLSPICIPKHINHHNRVSVIDTPGRRLNALHHYLTPDPTRNIFPFYR